MAAAAETVAVPRFVIGFVRPNIVPVQRLPVDALALGPFRQDRATGDRVWNNKDDLGKGAIGYADGRFYLIAESSGQVVLIDADLSRKRRKKVIDKQAAAFILQGWLDAQRPSE